MITRSEPEQHPERSTFPQEGAQSKDDDLPPEALPLWLDDTCRALLNAIKNPERAKKRRTVILLASAEAVQKPASEVFARNDTCCSNIWHGDHRKHRNSDQVKPGWKHLADVAAAYEACCLRALDYADAETAALEAHYARQRRQAIGKYAAQAPMALAGVMASPDQRGADRINAALALIKLADPETRDVNTAPTAGDTTGPIVILPDNGRDNIAPVSPSPHRSEERGPGGEVGV